MSDDTTDSIEEAYAWSIAPRIFLFTNPYFMAISGDSVLEEAILDKTEVPVDYEVIWHDNSVRRLLKYRKVSEENINYIEAVKGTAEFCAGVANQHLERVIGSPQKSAHINPFLTAFRMDPAFWGQIINDTGMPVFVDIPYDEYAYLVGSVFGKDFITSEEAFYDENEGVKHLVRMMQLADVSLRDNSTVH